MDNKNGRILALDPGDVWVGVAHTDILQQFSFPYATWKRDSFFEEFTRYFSINKVSEIVVGYPITMASKVSKETEKVILFKKLIEEQYPSMPIFFQDERLTSRYAKSAKIFGFGGKNSDHAIAAAVILDTYLTKRSYNK